MPYNQDNRRSEEVAYCVSEMGRLVGHVRMAQLRSLDGESHSGLIVSECRLADRGDSNYHYPDTLAVVPRGERGGAHAVHDSEGCDNSNQ